MTSKFPFVFNSLYLYVNSDIVELIFLTSYYKVFSFGNVLAKATVKIVVIKQRDKTIVE